MSRRAVTKALTNRCKCCLRERSSKDLWSEHFSDGDPENYGAMITSCFQLSWREPASESEQEIICHPCIGRLRDAYLFKQQVLEAQTFMSGVMEEDATEIELKMEQFLDSHLKPSNNGMIMKMEKTDDDNDSSCSYTEVEYLEIENDEKASNDIIILKSDDNSLLERETVNDNMVLLGNTVIKKVKLGSPQANIVPKGTKKEPTKSTLSQSFNKITDILSNEKTKENKKGAYVHKPPEENRNLQYQVQRIKHQDNLSALLLNTNATPIHNKRDTGYECGFCSEAYIKAADLKDHVIQHHTNEDKDKYMAERELCTFIVKLDITDLQCNHCAQPLDDLESAWEHLTTHNISYHSDIKNQIIPYKFTSEPFQCFKCNAEFAHFRALHNHMNTHYPNYMCESCGAGYVTNRAMLLHARMHGDGSYQCAYCPKQFSVRLKWKMHERQIHQRKTGRPLSNVCGFCGERFNDHIKKYRHLEQKHGVKRTMYQCDLCSKTLATKKTLRNHIANVHYKLKNFQCPMCNKECYDKTNMTRHMETHKKQSRKLKGIRCDYCPKIFRREASLKLHLRAHTGDSQHICELCSEPFLMKAGLLSHLRSKHGVSYTSNSRLGNQMEVDL